MKLIWTRELDAQNPWEPDFHGVFFYQESEISFYYKDEHLFPHINYVVGMIRGTLRILALE